MKKVVIFASVALIAVIAAGFYFYNSNFYNSNNEIPLQEESSSSSGEQIILENSSEKTEEPKEIFKIIYPTLTYEGAYNGPLYATSEQVGIGYPIEKYFSNLDRNGVNWFIGFYTFSEEPKESNLIGEAGVGYVISVVKKYPRRVLPFYNPGFGGEEVEPIVGDKLTAIYARNLKSTKEIVGENFVLGLGEIETQEWKIAHNDPKVNQLFDLAKSNNINFMFHPVASKIDQVDQIAKAYPNQKIIIHMYREDLDNSKNKVIKILQENENIYFSIDAAHIAHSNKRDIVYEYEKSTVTASKSAFISDFDSNYKKILSDAVSDYKPLVEAVPNKVLWGTEAGPEYTFEPEVYDRLIKISRELIGQMPLEHQEFFAYKNAMSAFGEGVIFDKEIKFIDTSSWTECANVQINECDAQCEIPDMDILTIEQETCFRECLIEKHCIDSGE